MAAARLSRRAPKNWRTPRIWRIRKSIGQEKRTANRLASEQTIRKMMQSTWP